VMADGKQKTRNACWFKPAQENMEDLMELDVLPEVITQVVICACL